ncbi:ImmA/IrrE family metallo-endopeptidase [uncultured Aeromicrobium sp.]|uniref:ImmA/IrrE family metallo-endopeptidase n=1 Tax=uncultured Aeromicrobium sp. TaxID=337820 RepID=UPI0025EA7081|nr:ImmA/IrrE family metallo-endopeptidase [uncultured Aeromicrobium sp.]
MFHPYQYAGEHHPDWVIRFDDLHGIPEIMCWTRRVILIEHAHDQRERRCSLTHALGHIELEHRGSEFDTKEEESADRWAARMLIDLENLAHAAQWRGWIVSDDLAHDLRVDRRTLDARLRTLHPNERAYLGALRNRLEHVA